MKGIFLIIAITFAGIVLKKFFHIVVVSFLSLLLIFGSSAKEFVHLFAHHEDTIHHSDHVCPPGEAHFENEHHHCAFLHFVLEPFANDAFAISLPQLRNTYNAVKNAALIAVFIPCNLYEIASRGPPQTVV